jgi:hypothetical protein
MAKTTKERFIEKYRRYGDNDRAACNGVATSVIDPLTTFICMDEFTVGGHTDWRTYEAHRWTLSGHDGLAAYNFLEDFGEGPKFSLGQGSESFA